MKQNQKTSSKTEGLFAQQKKHMNILHIPKPAIMRGTEQSNIARN